MSTSQISRRQMLATGAAVIGSAALMAPLAAPAAAAATGIVQRQRGRHEDYVFVYRRERVKNFDQAPEMQYHRIGTMNTNAYQDARRAAGLSQVRIHDLRHTFGQRLRDAGVSEEDRALLLGHSISGMPQHYATATVARLVDVANRVFETRDRTTLLRVANG